MFVVALGGVNKMGDTCFLVKVSFTVVPTLPVPDAEKRSMSGLGIKE
jgi:hypothetical protein